MKKALKLIFSAAAVLSLLFVSAVVIMIFSMPRGLHRYSEQEMHSWVDNQINIRARSCSRSFFNGRAETQEIRDDVHEYIQYLMDNDAKCRYELSSMILNVSEQAKSTDIVLTVKYKDDGRYEDLKYVSDELEAIGYVTDSLSRGVTDIFFRTGSGWDSDKVGAIGDAVIYNAADIAAVAEDYTYYAGIENTENNNYAHLRMHYNVNETLLKEANAELDAALDTIEARLRASGISDRRALYRAIADEVTGAAEYDHVMAELVSNENRSEQEWVESSAYGALVMGRTVCTGYAMAYKALCDRMALPCWVVNGYTEDAGHVWNMIELDGENYYTDCTFADTALDDSWLLMNEREYAGLGYYTASNSVTPW